MMHVGTAAVLTVLVLWDLYVAFVDDPPHQFDLEANVFRRIGARLSGIPIAIGALVGHAWHPEWAVTGGGLLSLAAFGCVAAAITGAHFLARRTSFRPPQWFALVYFVVGLPLGAVMWP